MQRRRFLQSLGVVAAISTSSKAAEVAATQEDQALARILIEKNDQRISQILSDQLLEPDSPFVGGFPNPQLICFVGSAAWNLCYLAAGWVSPDSRYFQSAHLEERMNLAIDFLRRMQHDDGTIDLVSTNFHSPPDTGFTVEPIALALGIVRRHQLGRLTHFQKAAVEFLTSAGQALARGGIHTPNHRWVVCMALARIHQLLPDDRHVKRIDQWLAEGIDIDADGQYAERSTSVYTPLVNRCLLTVAKLLDRPELYDPVRRNLEMTRFLVRPNGEIVTEMSRRQDQSRRSLVDGYHYAYDFMARMDSNGDFSAMVDWIEKLVGKENLHRRWLYRLEENSGVAPLPPARPLPTNYERHFPHSDIVRIRRGNVDASIVANNSTLFALHRGAAVLQSLRLASAFFGKGQFQASTLDVPARSSEEAGQRAGGYRLTQQLTGPYVQPLAADLLPGDGDWSKMPLARRAQSEVQQLTTQITIREAAGRFKIHFVSLGTARVPWAIELGFRAGGELSGVTPIDGIDDAYLVGEQGGSYRVGDDVIRFSSGPVQHRWTELRGALPKLDAQCVYLTGYTPLDFELTIG